eukprot:199140-Ditylum_brightwellii.AAC.1
MNHGKANTTTGKQLRANIEAHKVELGTGTSLFATDHNIYHHCAMFTWLSWAWEFLWKHGIRLEEETPNLKLQRVNDCFLTEAFARAGFVGKALDSLNQCQLYLRVSTLANITSGNGCYIVSNIFN